MLRSWLRCLMDASIPEVKHLILAPGYTKENFKWLDHPQIQVIFPSAGKTFDIGHLHNIGISQANSDWVMKLDVDCMMHTSFFKELLDYISGVQGHCNWFNIGMFYLKPGPSLFFKNSERKELNEEMASTFIHGSPTGSQFVCKRATYLHGGGCLSDFHGYGWEDYQQLYMLASNNFVRDPLPGEVTLENVTNRCRDEISRKYTRITFKRNPLLFLLHCHHKKHATMDYLEYNRKVLYDYVISKKWYFSNI
jgi:predicted glycosyltransferase involved in capsule biosynthesis